MILRPIRCDEPHWRWAAVVYSISGRQRGLGDLSQERPEAVGTGDGIPEDSLKSAIDRAGGKLPDASKLGLGVLVVQADAEPGVRLAFDPGHRYSPVTGLVKRVGLDPVPGAGQGVLQVADKGTVGETVDRGQLGPTHAVVAFAVGAGLGVVCPEPDSVEATRAAVSPGASSSSTSTRP